MQEEEMGTEESNGVLWMLRHYSSVTCMCSHTRTHVVIVIKEPGSWYKRCQSTMQSNAVSKDTLSFHLFSYPLPFDAPGFTPFLYLPYVTFQWQIAPRSDLQEHVLTWESMKFHIESFLLVHMDWPLFFPGCSGSVVRFALTGMVIGMET